jgi:predicted DNA-binding transcriptional regulator AlpA
VRGKLLKMEEAAEKTGMSVEWIYKHMRKGTLPFAWFMPCPGKRLVDSADIEDWQRLIKVPAGAMPGDIQGGFMQ